MAPKMMVATESRPESWKVWKACHGADGDVEFWGRGCSMDFISTTFSFAMFYCNVHMALVNPPAIKYAKSRDKIINPPVIKYPN